MRRIFVGVVVSMLGAAAFAAQPEAGMDKRQIASYFAVISCVDRTFYDGGYDEGDPDRESLMSEALAKYGLPKYDEALFQKESKIEQDHNSYMTTYMACSEDEWLIKVAEQRGITPEE